MFLLLFQATTKFVSGARLKVMAYPVAMAFANTTQASSANTSLSTIGSVSTKLSSTSASISVIQVSTVSAATSFV